MGFVHLEQVTVHLREVLIDELVDDLRGQVNPNVQNPVLWRPLEGFNKVLLDVGDYRVGPAKVVLVPVTVGLTFIGALLTERSVGQKVVDEFNRKDLDLVILFESTNVDVVSLCDVKEDTIDEEEEGLDVEELAPREAKVKEEFCESLVVNPFPVELFLFLAVTHLFLLLASF